MKYQSSGPARAPLLQLDGRLLQTPTELAYDYATDSPRCQMSISPGTNSRPGDTSPQANTAGRAARSRIWRQQKCRGAESTPVARSVRIRDPLLRRAEPPDHGSGGSRGTAGLKARPSRARCGSAIRTLQTAEPPRHGPGGSRRLPAVRLTRNERRTPDADRSWLPGMGQPAPSVASSRHLAVPRPNQTVT
jgi:hypothetical protein